MNASKAHWNKRAARFWSAFAQVFLPPPRLLPLQFGMDKKLRERVMLAVSEVNGCAFCAQYHTREALKAGLDAAEIQDILKAGYSNVPKEHLTAVLYAQHWADTQGQTDPEAQVRFESAYNPDTQRRILLSIRFINVMNFMFMKWERLAARFGHGPRH